MTHHVDQLDRALLAHGEDIELRRPATGTVTNRLPVRARLRGFQPAELVGGIVQTDVAVIMSPSEINAAGVAWPGIGFDRWPKKGDRFGARGAPYVIQSGGPVIIGGQVVRLEFVARGATT